MEDDVIEKELVKRENIAQISNLSTPSNNKQKKVFLYTALFVVVVVAVVACFAYLNIDKKEQIKIVESEEPGILAAKEVEGVVSSESNDSLLKSDALPLHTKDLIPEKIGTFVRGNIRESKETCMTIGKSFGGDSLKSYFDNSLFEQEMCESGSATTYRQSSATNEHFVQVSVQVYKLTSGAEAYVSTLNSATKLLVPYKGHNLFSASKNSYTWATEHDGNIFLFSIMLTAYNADLKISEEVLDLLLKNNPPISSQMKDGSMIQNIEFQETIAGYSLVSKSEGNECQEFCVEETKATYRSSRDVLIVTQRTPVDSQVASSTLTRWISQVFLPRISSHGVYTEDHGDGGTVMWRFSEKNFLSFEYEDIPGEKIRSEKYLEEFNKTGIQPEALALKDRGWPTLTENHPLITYFREKYPSIDIQ